MTLAMCVTMHTSLHFTQFMLLVNKQGQTRLAKYFTEWCAVLLRITRSRKHRFCAAQSVLFILMCDMALFTRLTTDERRALEGEVVRKCLSRTDKQVC